MIKRMFMMLLVLPLVFLFVWDEGVASQDNSQEKVVLDNLQALVGKQSTGNPVLDALNFKIESIEGTRIKVEIDVGSDTIESFTMFKDDGSEIRRGSYSGWENKFSYDFRGDISKVKKCELEVIVSQEKVKVPFSLEQIPLP